MKVAITGATGLVGRASQPGYGREAILPFPSFGETCKRVKFAGIRREGRSSPRNWRDSTPLFISQGKISRVKDGPRHSSSEFWTAVSWERG